MSSNSVAIFLDLCLLVRMDGSEFGSSFESDECVRLRGIDDDVRCLDVFLLADVLRFLCDGGMPMFWLINVLVCACVHNDLQFMKQNF